MNQIKSNSQRLAACVVQTQQKRLYVNTTETRPSVNPSVRPSKSTVETRLVLPTHTLLSQ